MTARPALLIAAALALAAPAAAHARPPADAPAAGAAVSVSFGADLRSEEARYGAQENKVLRDLLVRAVARRAAKGGFSRLDLVIEYARPNRPTFNQLSLEPSLSVNSLAIGGATVTGTAYTADGASRPLRFSWYESDLSQEYGVTTWSDADRAFQLLGEELAHGRTPDRFGPGRLQPRPYLNHRNVF